MGPKLCSWGGGCGTQAVPLGGGAGEWLWREGPHLDPNDWMAGLGRRSGPLFPFPPALLAVGGACREQGGWEVREAGRWASSKEPVHAAQKLDLLQLLPHSGEGWSW